LIGQGYTVINDFGPTEATVSGATWKCPPDFEGNIVPIGRPVIHSRLYILDKNGQSVPLGVAGELYIGGVAVARGYLNRPELTAEVFLPDPFTDEPGARMYKTGDQARYLPDGNVVFLGRNDHQVKIRGFRIELGEIDARLAEHPVVLHATVIASDDGHSNRLVAYIVASPNEELGRVLRDHLSTKLPSYMIPSVFVRLDELPLNSNGKLDRRKLPEPSDEDFIHQKYDAPQGGIESALRDIWMQILGIARIGRHDDFFMLGGHSLLAVKMISQIQSVLGFKVSLGAVFEAPTIAQLAPRLLGSSGSSQDAFNVLLPIKPHGTREPLFCIHPALGLSWCFIGLSRHLHADQPIYGLQARGFSDNDKPAATFDELLLDYMNQIRQIQPHGPYKLLGYSFGGMVAHSIASLLERQGEKVALLGIMDARPSNHESVAVTEIEAVTGDAGVNIVRSLAGKEYSTDDNVTDLERAFWRKAPEVVQWVMSLDRTHSTPSFSGDMVLFRATERTRPNSSLISALDWKPYVKGEIEVKDINCKHNDMGQPGSIAEIGGVLAQRLEEIHVASLKED
jgi:thioesterase domain-containing protein